MTVTSAPARRKASGATTDVAPFAQSATIFRPFSGVGCDFSGPTGAMAETRWSMYRLVAVAVSWLTRPTPAPVGRSQSWPSTASISSSLVSGSLKPPRAKNLMPLSGIGLWDAEITAPISTLSTDVRYATPGVGMMPASITSKPPADMPADNAAARKSPETRVSRPTSARRRLSNSLRSSSPSTRTAASPKSSASCAVKSLFANPRTPSVPNIRGMSLKSSLSANDISVTYRTQPCRRNQQVTTQSHNTSQFKAFHGAQCPFRVARL